MVRSVKVEASELQYSGAVLALRVDQVVMPDGHLAKREVVENWGAVGIVALNGAGSVALIHQYRHPLGMRLWEIPAGLLDNPSETPLQAAQRELAEEAGLVAHNWATLVDIATSPGFSDETVRIFLAQELEPIEHHAELKQRFEINEETELDTVFVPLDQAVNKIAHGEIINSIAVSGILAAQAVHTRQLAVRASDIAFPNRSTRFATRKNSAEQ